MGAFSQRGGQDLLPGVAPSQVEVVFPTAFSFLEATRVGPSACELRVRTAEKLWLGSVVKLRLGFAFEALRYELEGRVVRRVGEGEAAASLLSIEGPSLLPFARIYACARSKPERLGTRAFERVAVDTRVEFERGGAWLSGMVLDLSRGGLFVATSAPRPSPYELVQLRIPTGWFRRAELLVRVARLGHVQSRAGFGAAFVHLSAEAERWLSRSLGQPPPP